MILRVTRSARAIIGYPGSCHSFSCLKLDLGYEMAKLLSSDLTRGLHIALPVSDTTNAT